MFLTKCKEIDVIGKDKRKSSFQDFGFNYFYFYETDLLEGTYALCLTDSLVYSYASLENGVAFEEPETTPEYGMPNGKWTSLNVYQLKQSTDSIHVYERIRNYKLDGRDVIREKLDKSVLELKFIGNDKLVFGSNVQVENSNLFEKKQKEVETTLLIRKLFIQAEL